MTKYHAHTSYESKDCDGRYNGGGLYRKWDQLEWEDEFELFDLIVSWIAGWPSFDMPVTVTIWKPDVDTYRCRECGTAVREDGTCLLDDFPIECTDGTLNHEPGDPDRIVGFDRYNATDEGYERQAVMICQSTTCDMEENDSRRDHSAEAAGY